MCNCILLRVSAQYAFTEFAQSDRSEITSFQSRALLEALEVSYFIELRIIFV